MRTVTGAIVLALGLAAQPAFAGEGAAPAQGGSAPLYTAMAVTPMAATALTPSLAAVSLSAVSLAAGPLAAVPLTRVTDTATAPDTFRLASIAMPAVPAARPLSGELGDAGLRRRFTGNSMMEFYPFAGSGFHFSGGTRLFSRRNFITETEDSARGMLKVSRSIMAPMTTRAGFKRFNPAVTAGYTFAVSHLAQIGIEGGALMTHAFAGTPGLPHHAFGYRGDHSVRPDAIANLVFGMHF